MSVRTRFAPSPTGFLHIGGVRTALFNWLYARQHGGQFILRIDDTDQARNQEETIAPILDGFRWLGMDWDEGPEVGGPHSPYYQSERRDTYTQWVAKLFDGGFLYYDYSTKEEREADKARCDEQKRPYRFREKTLTDAEMAEVSDKPYSIRFRVPLGRTLVIDDIVRGTITWQTDDISDFVVMKYDGSPLYSFATVVDDVLMSISHVIRAEEHLSNTPPQLLIYEAMGFAPPQFAHLPYVAAPGSKKKMSKRDGGACLHEYQGDYLPDAMVNYLARLGWSLDGVTEFMTRESLIENFSLDRVVHAPASHDANKLHWFQGEWMKTLKTEEKVKGSAIALIEAGLVTAPLSDVDVNHLTDVVEALGDRLKTFSDIVSIGGFFFKSQVAWDADAVQKRLIKPEGVREILKKFRNLLEGIKPDEWTTTNLELWIHSLAELEEFKMGTVVNAIRVAITGQAVGPGLYETMVILGQNETVNRLNATIVECFT